MTQKEKSIGTRGESGASGAPQEAGAQKAGESGESVSEASVVRSPRASKPRSAKSKGPTRKKGEPLTGRAVMRKAYKNLSEKFDKPEDASKAIDDLVKLVKLEKDWGGDKKGAKEIKVRWEQGEDKSSSEK